MEDAVGAIVTVLGSWTSTNTDNTKPYKIAAAYTEKFPDTRFGDYVLVYSASHNERQASLGYTHIDYDDVVSVDIRTSYGGNDFVKGRAHLIKMRDEARRLVYASRTSLGGYRLAKIGHVQDLSDKSTMLWRMVVDVMLRKVIDTVPA